MKKILILCVFTLTGCLSIVNNNGGLPQETNTGLGAIRQLPAEQETPQLILLPNGQYAILATSPTPTRQPPVQVNVEGNYLLPSPTPDMSEMARDLPNPPVNRQLVTDCLPCECAPCETPTPEPTPTPYSCTSLDKQSLATILDNAGYTGQYTFCRSLSDGLMLDVAFDTPSGIQAALLNSPRKKEFTALTRQNVPALKINNRLITDEANGKTNTIREWLDCQLDRTRPISGDDLPALPQSD